MPRTKGSKNRPKQNEFIKNTPHCKKKRFTVRDDETLEKIKKNCVDTLSFRRSHSIFKITAYSL